MHITVNASMTKSVLGQDIIEDTYRKDYASKIYNANLNVRTMMRTHVT